jgi:hypothetical protein
LPIEEVLHVAAIAVRFALLCRGEGAVEHLSE